MKALIKTTLLVILGLFVAGAAGALLYFKWAIERPNSSLSAHVVFTIEKGEGRLKIAQNLKEKGLIKSDFVFLIASEIKDKEILPGMYNLPTNLNILQILDKISTGEAKITKVLIPEGYRLEQIAQVLSDKGFVKYDDFIKEAGENEGQLFPDTYYITPEQSVSDIVSTMKANFIRRTSDFNLTQEDLVIASIVEREAANDADRGMIASVYKNRIRIGMKLQSDPTVEYARDTINLKKLSLDDQVNYSYWKSAKTIEFTSVISPYNTYQASALPPTPICNPGLKSIEAALNPIPNDYLFFLYGTDGKIYFAKTMAQHEANVIKYLR